MSNITDTTFRFASANPGGNKRVRNVLFCTFTWFYHVAQSAIFTYRPSPSQSAFTVVANFSLGIIFFYLSPLSPPCFVKPKDWN